MTKESVDFTTGDMPTEIFRTPVVRRRILTNANTAIKRLVAAIAAAALLIDTVLITYNVALRYFTGTSLLSTTELSTICLALIAFLGAAAATHDGMNLGMGTLIRLWPERVRTSIEAVGYLASILFLVVLAYEAIQLGLTINLDMPATGLPHWILYVPLVLGSAFMALSAFLSYLALDRRGQLTGVLMVALLGAVVWSWQDTLTIWAQTQPLVVVSVLVIAGLVLAIPIVFTFAIAATLALTLTPGTVYTTLPLQVTHGATSFTLLALPMFIFAGAFLASSGISLRLVRVVDDLTCRWRGGSGIASVIAMYIFSGLSGSKLADIAAVNPVSTPAMEEKGHSREEMVGIYSASAVMGETVPPSIAMLVLASVASVSTRDLFLAGLLPAAVLGLCLILAVFLRARQQGLESSPRPPAREISSHLFSAILPLGMPVVLVVGIAGGIATPVEAGALAVVYGLVLSVVVYRVSLREVGRLLVSSAKISGMLLFLLGVASLLVWVMTIGGLARQLEEVTHPFRESALGFTLVSIVVLVIAGMVFEGLPALIIFGPIFLPLAVVAGINDLQYSVLLIMVMGVGAFLPPLGIGYYGTCAIVDVQPEKAILQTLFYKGIVMVGMLIVAMVPWITTFVPGLIG